jgi:lysophospholipase L1-like esterase
VGARTARAGRIAALTVAATAATIAAAGAGASAEGTTVRAGAAGIDLAGRQYVALGDSYSAGFGLTPYSDQPASGCYQAEENYPHLVAAAFSLELDDRTCSGATTLNVTTTPQETITGAGTAPVQADALSPDTDLVTITIGGNDLGFADVAESCIARSAAGPLVWDIDGIGYTTCREAYVRTVDGFTVDLLADRIEDVVAPRLDATFALVAERAPNAKVVSIGYPAIAPGADVFPDGCYSSPLGTGPLGLDPPFPTDTFPFTGVDTLYLHEIERKLDAAIRAAAEAHGAAYLSTMELTRAHSACAPAGEAYIAGLTLTNDATDANSTPIGDTGYGVLLGALHPNAAGVAFLSGQVIAAVTEAFAEPGVGAPEPAAPGSAAPVTAPRADPQLAEGGSAFPVAAWAGIAVALLACGATLVRARRGPARAGDR